MLDLGAGKVVGASPVGRNPVLLDGPHQAVADPKRGVAYVVLAYPASVQAAANHQHGTGKLPGWVQAIALDDFRAVGEVRIDPNPGEIALSDDGARLVVSHFDLAAAALTGDIDTRRATLALVDPSAIRSFDTPQPDTLLTCVAPHGIALARPDGATAFVACYGEDALGVVNLADVHAPVVRVPVGPGARTDGAPAYGPYGVALSPDGTRVAIGTKDSKEVRFFDVRAGAMESLVVPALGAAYVTAWSADGARLYVPTQDVDAISVVDAKTGASLTSRRFDTSCVAPVDVALAPSGDAIYVVCEGTATTPGTLVTLDPTTLATRASVGTGFFPGRPYVGRGS
jgi:DNA-binding beta-propeller fold protein YncE